ncbi:uncharacterized protein EI97DRAFT_295408 [Westerdykella ornata]|uniref:DUF3752 domain-containing protein n=1 Tax=Westerdykella ornata TaxID=318751 RepID=A0A6A6JLN5_WESOR|nr:uncharacterized protein EI97DRAFT_295408 [Westerdykella ornata]KAF2277501.1 hypothetical protein EI97DRAFT_295408 [Westerdykella ornata]
MSSIGPSPSPHHAKRGRDADNDRSPSPQSSEKRRRILGPAPPPASDSAPNQSPTRVLGPSLPPTSPSRSSSPENAVEPALPGPVKIPRVIGPSAPPAPLSEIPHSPPSDDSDSSDDEFGPAAPPLGTDYAGHEERYASAQPSVFDTDPQYAEHAKKTQRDEWMTMPPTQDDLAARMDPTKLRARKFNTGKGARGAGSSGNGMGVWTETPDEKLKRLQNEALGVSAPANMDGTSKYPRKSKEEEDKARRIREKLDAARGKSLMEQHKEGGGGKDKEDDPSKRGFDWEKDMGTGMRIGDKQRNEMLKRAKGFGDRFSSGSFL